MKLETANEMTPQQLLDYAVEKLVAQGSQCTGEFDKGDCLYGDKHGNHCLIGWCLDETNTVLMQFVGSVHELVAEERGAVPSPIAENLHLFDVAQGFHDLPLCAQRAHIADMLEEGFQIDITAPHWRQWIELGDAL